MNKTALHLLLIVTLLSSISARTFGQKIFEKEYILSIMQKVNKYQLAYLWTLKNDYNWIRGTYYTGVMACYQKTGDKTFLKQCLNWGKEHDWKVAPREWMDEGGANPLTCAQTWLECYKFKGQKKMIEDVQVVLADPVRLKTPASNPEKWFYEGGRIYVDALYVGAPVLAMLYNITGDEKYLKTLDHFYWTVVNTLYDKDLHLFYRDTTFIQNPNGNNIKYDACTLAGARGGKLLERQISVFDKKVVWARGNGWALGSLVRVIKYLPENTPSRQRYISLFKEFAEGVKNAQSPDGYWHVNLDDAKEFPNPESSGTGFFVYGLAWGINSGYLDASKYSDTVKRGWIALHNTVNKDGKVQWGQMVGHSPAYVVKEDSHEYVTGTFLLAASEVYQLKQ